MKRDKNYYNKPKNECFTCGDKCWGLQCRDCFTAGALKLKQKKKKFDRRVGRIHPNKIYREKGYQVMPSMI